jgi:hypothetical protein
MPFTVMQHRFHHLLPATVDGTYQFRVTDTRRFITSGDR